MALTLNLAPSGMELDQWSGDLKEMYTKSALIFSTGLPKSPSSSSIASSSGASSYYSMESGISSMSAESTPSYQQLLSSNYETLLLSALDIPRELKIDAVEEPKTNDTKKADTIMYQGRNLLDLASNITGRWDCQPAILPEGIGSFYFDNRSQYSRLQGAEPPKHTIAKCNEDQDCNFEEPNYS